MLLDLGPVTPPPADYVPPPPPYDDPPPRLPWWASKVQIVTLLAIWCSFLALLMVVEHTGTRVALGLVFAVDTLAICAAITHRLLAAVHPL